MDMSKAYRTQWVAQYAVASELVRRGYLVGILQGNMPIKDILVESQNGVNFSVQVKGVYKKNAFWVKREQLLDEKGMPRSDLFFVFVNIPEKINEPLDFWIMKSSETLDIMNQYLSDHPDSRYADSGFSFKYINDKPKNEWNKLPK